MTTTTTLQRSVEAGERARRRAARTIEQLALLPADDVPAQVRLSQRTRRLGLAGIAMARAILADQAARRREAAAEADHISPPRAA
jgi:hypothetical protein